MMIPSDDTFGMPGLTIETILLRYFSEGGVTLPDFSHVGVRGAWLNVQREFRTGQKFSSGVSKIADFRHVDMEGQTKGELPV